MNALQGAPIDHFREMERRCVDDRPFDVEGLRSSTLGPKANLEDTRAAFRSYYREVYGSGNSLVQALALPHVNYYRLDCARLAQYPVVDPGVPVMAFLPPFTNLAADAPIEDAMSAEERFFAYFGCDADGLVRLVERGHVFLLHGPMDDYKGPFMRELFRKLGRLPEERRPVFGRPAEAANDRGPRSENRLATERYAKRIAGAGLPEWTSRYRVRINGHASGLPAVFPHKWLEERMGWFDLVLPATAWPVVLRLWARLAEAPCRERLDDLMQVTFVFTHVFHAPLLYSRGGSVRATRRDLEHWKTILQTVHVDWAARREPWSRYVRVASKVGSMASLAASALDTLSTRSPATLLHTDGADAWVSRKVPRCLQSENLGKALDAVSEVQDDLAKEAAKAADARRGLQSVVVRAGRVPDRLHGEVHSAVDVLRERLEGLRTLEADLKYEQQQALKCSVHIGAGVVSTALPALAQSMKLLQVGFDLYDAHATRAIRRGVEQAMSPDLHLYVDVIQPDGPIL